MEELMNIPQEEDQIAHLYSLIRQNPDLLPAIDKQQFADTPLHLAAGKGRTRLALEIQLLMPSFGRKLNPDGLSPLHLALRSGNADNVTAMIKLDPQLVRVRGRGGETPLHYAAKRGNVDFLAEFLLICPDSIDELTVCGESAVHVAAKNGKWTAVRILLGWLKRLGRSREVLGWRDWEGNTVLHLAASTNNLEVIKILAKEVSVNDKNSKGMTPLDIAREVPIQVDESILQFLKWNKAKSGSCIPKSPKISTFSDYLGSPETINEWIIKLNAYLILGMSSQTRNSILVVAALIATATFQAVLSPPGGFSDQSSFTNATTSAAENGIGIVRMPINTFLAFTTFNSIALAASLGMIFLVLPFSASCILLHLSISFLMVSYIVAIKATSPPHDAAAVTAITTVANVVFSTITCIKMFFRRKGSVGAYRRLIGSNYFYNINEARTLVLHNKYLSNADI